jgi:signal transduction histidine kinase
LHCIENLRKLRFLRKYQPYSWLLGLGCAAGLATVLLYTLPGVDVAYRSPASHVAVETAASLIALLVAYLVAQRFRLRARVTSLLLVGAFTLLALTNLAFLAIPAALPGISTGRFSTWSALAGAFLGAAVLAGAAFAPNVPVPRPGRTLLAVLGGCGLALAIDGLVVLVLGDHLPLGLNPAIAPAAAHFAGNEILHAMQLVIMTLFVCSAIGFARRGVRRDDTLMKWIAAGCLLAAFSRFDYFLFPSLYSDWVFIGDAFRLGFYVLLLVGAALEIHTYQRALAQAVLLDERRRLARDLHDGLAQELAFIGLQAKRLDAKGHSAEAQPIISAAQRALDESRYAISALTRTVDAPIDEAIADEARAVAARAGARVELSLTRDLAIRPESREAALRIVREAITNATRHGKAKSLRVELVGGPEVVRLRVIDDGSGFDGQTSEGGFGLQSMRERAENLGGTLSVITRPGAGTIVEAVLP